MVAVDPTCCVASEPGHLCEACRILANAGFPLLQIESNEAELAVNAEAEALEGPDWNALARAEAEQRRTAAFNQRRGRPLATPLPPAAPAPVVNLGPMTDAQPVESEPPLPDPVFNWRR